MALEQGQTTPGGQNFDDNSVLLSFLSPVASFKHIISKMFNNNFEYKLQAKEADSDGNKLILDITINDKRMIVITYTVQTKIH